MSTEDSTYLLGLSDSISGGLSRGVEEEGGGGLVSKQRKCFVLRTEGALVDLGAGSQ